jgi:uncharacterized cupredoxin-like copper-binding protein
MENLATVTTPTVPASRLPWSYPPARFETNRSKGETTVTSRLRRLFVVPAAAALAFTIGSCGGDDGGIGATEADYSITLDESTAPAGEVTFDVTNEAEQPHEFVVFKTDLAEDALPVDADGNVDEEGDGVELVDELEDIAPGDNPSLTVTLDAANYVIICNIPGHYKQGMHTPFVVS